MLGSSGGIKRGSKVVNEKTRLTRDRSASPREDGERSVESSCDSLSLQEEMCGWGSWNPLKCQSLNNSRWVLFFFCTMACIQGGFFSVSALSYDKNAQVKTKIKRLHHFHFFSRRNGRGGQCESWSRRACMVKAYFASKAREQISNFSNIQLLRHFS